MKKFWTKFNLAWNIMWSKEYAVICNDGEFTTEGCCFDSPGPVTACVLNIVLKIIEAREIKERMRAVSDEAKSILDGDNV